MFLPLVTTRQGQIGGGRKGVVHADGRGQQQGSWQATWQENWRREEGACEARYSRSLAVARGDQLVSRGMFLEFENFGGVK